MIGTSNLYLPVFWIKTNLFSGHLLQLYSRFLIWRKVEDRVMLTQLEAQMNVVTLFSVYCNDTLNSVSYKMYSLTVFILSWTSKVCRLSANTLKCNDDIQIYF